MTNLHKKNTPNLFIVGAPKCGTTSLHNWLSQHPEIFMSEEKEPFYLCTDKIQEADEYNKEKTLEFKYRNERDYLSLFAQAKNEKYKGEASTKYLFSEEAVKNILRLSPNAKIIIMLRNPVDFLHSWHSHRIRGGIEDLGNFKKALQAEQDRKQHKNMPRKVICPSDLFYTELAHFSEHIKNYQKHFPSEQIKIGILEEMKEDPQGVYQEILEFLQVEDTRFIPDFNIYNRNAKPRSKRLNNFIKNSKYVKKTFRFVMPNKIRRKINLTVEEWNKKTVPRPPLPEKTKKELMAKFEPEVEKLSDITDKDLKTMWGYKE